MAPAVPSAPSNESFTLVLFVLSLGSHAQPAMLVQVTLSSTPAACAPPAANALSAVRSP